MKAYFASDKKDKELITLISKHCTLVNNRAKKEISDPKTFFKLQKELIDTVDIVIVEITNASVDIGGIVVYVLTKNIPVLALIFEEEKDTISPMIAGNPSDSLFIEHYTHDNVSYVLRDFLSHATNAKKRVGKFVVIDGGDGSGKATQTKLLSDFLKKNKILHKVYDFPRYYSSFHGAVVGRMLSGEFGTLDSLSPYLSSLAYALDRASVKEEMYDFLHKGGFIISNRYVPSNMAFQGAKFENPLKQEKYLSWVSDLEYKVHRIPREDMVIYLHVPSEISRELTHKKSSREYVKGKKLDIYEENLSYQKTVEKLYLELCSKHPTWRVVECVDKKGKMKSIPHIHKEIVRILKANQIIRV